MTDLSVEARLDRLENLMATAGDMMLQTLELSRQNLQRADRIEQQTERNSRQIERNSQQIERNSQQIEQTFRLHSQLEQTMAQLALDETRYRAEFAAFQQTTQAALEKIDRVLDYLMQRDGDS
ncbi:MAG: hypothetical protein AAFR26_15555 [Cyanobacteria bacterium J06626_4]